MEATPRPWRLAKSSVRSSFATNWRTIEPNVVGVGTFTRTSEWGGDETCSGVEISEANAEFIVRAVNAHDRLIEALEWALNGIDAALVDVRATRRRGSLDPGLEAAEYNLTHLMNDVDAALALARGEGEA